MGRYVARRLLQLIPVFLGTTFLIYFLVWSVPGDPFAGKCGERPCAPAYIEMMKAKYNMDDPIIVQYWKYLLKLLQGDLGENYAGQPIADMIAQAYPTTVKLALVALAFSGVIGIIAGVVTGLSGRGFLDNLVLVSTLLLISLPTFVTGYLVQVIFGVNLGLVPPTVSSAATFYELLAPGIVLGNLSMAYVARLTRTSIMENKRADYVRTAVAKGLPRHRVVTRHLLRNSLIPVVTFLGADIGFLMGGAIVTERIFNIHGVGYQLYQGIVRQNTQTVVGFVTVLVLVFLLCNLVVDLLYAVLDPRIRYV